MSASLDMQPLFCSQAEPGLFPQAEPRFFPAAGATPEPSPADLAACRDMLRCGSRSFFAASLLLPRHVHQPATALYAFCRQSDDVIDAPEPGTDAPCVQQRLAGLHRRLDRAYAGRPKNFPADRAFAAVIDRFAMPRMLPEMLLDGFAWDATHRRYDTEADLHDYAARVAGSVGAMMAVLMGARTRTAIARAGELGIAMQLTNIARDVGEDARAGRLYLPLEWLRDEGIDPDRFLAQPACSQPLRRVVRRLIDSSEQLYARGMSGIAELPAACRPGIRAAALLYAEIGREVARLDYDTVTARARVPAARKAALLAASLLPRAATPAHVTPKLETPPLPALNGIIAECALSPRPPLPRKPLGERLVWLLDLFSRLQESRLPSSGAMRQV